MAGRAGEAWSELQDDELQRRVEVYLETGCNVAETSRRLGRTRRTIRHTLDKAVQAGLVTFEQRHERSGPKIEEYADLRAKKLARFQRKKSKGDWRKPVLVTLPEGPFRLKVFGDPHLDADGCNYELFERHWLEMSPADGVYGVCVGDWFNNWLRALSHLWKDEAPANEAYPLLQWLMEENGEGLIAACSGNHDDWTHAPFDPIDDLMKRHGVRYRLGAIRLAVKCGEAPAFTLGMRHKWRGSSMYSAAHGIRRAVEKGWDDLISIGGHIHQDEPRMFTHPSGAHSHICQVSTFKEFDDFTDVQGFMGPRISPAWDLVIDPRRPDTDPDKVKVWWTSEDAAAHLAALKSR